MYFQSDSPVTPKEAIAILRLLRIVDPDSIREVGNTNRVVLEMSNLTEEEVDAFKFLGKILLRNSKLLDMGPEVDTR